MSRLLKLSFRNAIWFSYTKNYNDSDRVIDIYGYKTDREDIPRYRNPITKYQISNMLHYLFGERPVPTHRDTSSAHKRIDYYMEMAENAFLKIDEIPIAVSKEDEKNNPPKNDEAKYRKELLSEYSKYPEEIMTLRKSVKNSWVKSVILTWEHIRYYINDNDKFDRYVKYLSNILNQDVRKVPYIHMITLVRELPLDTIREIYGYIKKMKKCDGLINIFGKFDKNNLNKMLDSDPSYAIRKGYSSNSKLFTDGCRLVNKNVTSVRSLSGCIVVPVTDEDVDRLRNVSTGCASLLDGGIVTIEGIISENDFMPYGYTRVGDISLELVKSFKKDK